MVVALLASEATSYAQETAKRDAPIVRIFEFVVASDLAAFMVAGRKNVQASIRDEPGVLSMHSVADKSDPTNLYVVEVYKDEAAYRAHVATTRFKDFINAIKAKVISRRVIETNPKMLGSEDFEWTEQ
ncbi:antibiotic biosynthesis monooxygenase [Sinorhizobium medicae]|nr:antibiotic biosynthesis monooxygenase [Sinorhizobium medicae]MQX77585.1 antibiotic biosynthesis monooxygenase [Sinorhizobium medicae]